jgi:vitamin B12 transporter
MFERTCLFACLAAGQALAASANLPPILITASRVAEPVEETLYSTSVVTRDELVAEQPRDVSEVLQQLPGVELGRNGGPGQATSIFLRGTASDHTLVLVDGVPMNSATVGAAALHHLMTEQFERVEVVRGPASTLYGSSAIGGVVQLFTRRPSPGANTELAVEAGSDHSDAYAASAGYGGDTFGAGFAASRRSSDGYPVRPSVSPLDRGYRNSSLSGNASVTLGPVTLDVSHLQSNGLVEYLNFFGAPVDQDTRNSLTRVSVEATPTTSWDSRLLLARSEDRIDENQSSDFAETLRDYVDWQNTFHLAPAHTLVAGATGSWTDASLLSFGSGYDERTRSLEVYLQDTREIGNTRLQFGGRAIDNEKYGTHFSWKAAVGHALGAATRVHANAGSAFRAPSANDLYGFGGNPDFDPETSVGGEIGISHQVTPEDGVRIVGFYTEIDNLIETNPVSFTVEQVERARIHGVELGYRHEGDHWHWSVDYTWQDPRNRDLDQQLPRRAQNLLHAGLGYQAADWWWQGNLRYQDERRDSRFSPTVMDAYTTVDLSAGYRFSRHVSVSGRVENLFDEDYELAATYPAQGRYVGVELRYDYAGD